MQLRIRKPGLLSTVQDLGRMFFLSQAVPISGAMDTLSARLANITLGNHETDAVIEFTYGGAELRAEDDLLIALSGDGALLSSDGELLPSDKPVFIPAGTTLLLANNITGSRSYLAIAGGWHVPEIMKSKSTYLPASFGGWQGRALKADDLLKSRPILNSITEAILSQLKGPLIHFPGWSIARHLLLPEDRKTVRVIPGREETWFEPDSLNDFYSGLYRCGNRSNRMGCFLDGPTMNRVFSRELLSTAVTPGTIQVPGDGGLVLLMADCQTTGGYPRIAQVASVDLPLCAQLKPGDAIRFKKITINEAESLYFEKEQEIKDLRNTIQRKYSCTD